MRELKFKVGCVVALDFGRNINTNYTHNATLPVINI